MSFHNLWVALTGYASGFASGFTAKEAISFLQRKSHVWLEHRTDNKVCEFLIKEFEANPRTPPDAYGHSQRPYLRSSQQIADAMKRSSVSILQRLERLQQEGRVERVAPKNDNWTVTENEFRDYMRKKKKAITTPAP